MHRVRSGEESRTIEAQDNRPLPTGSVAILELCGTSRLPPGRRWVDAWVSQGVDLAWRWEEMGSGGYGLSLGVDLEMIWLYFVDVEDK